MAKITRSLRIAMLIDAWFPSPVRPVGVYSGDQVYVRELKHLLETEHHCQVILFYQSHANIMLKLFWPLIAWLDVLIYNRYHKLDLIHAHGLWSSLAAKAAGSFLKIPVVQTVHSFPNLQKGKKTLGYFLEKYIFTKIHYTSQITVSQSFLQIKNINAPISVIPNGVNIRAFNRIRIKKREQPSLIWVGKNEPQKGISVLKKAIQKVRRQLPDLYTELVTGGRLTGTDLIKAYKKAHVFVLPSLIQGQPIALLEAWAARLPVVATEVGDNPVMISQGKNGLLVEPDNVKQLAAAILKVLRAKVSGTRMGEAGYHFVKDNFSWEKVARQTYEVYVSAQNQPESLQNQSNTLSTSASVSLKS